MNLPILIAGILLTGILAGAAYLIASALRNEKRAKKALMAREAQLKREAYEAEILRELGERFGYELNEQKIVEIIANSIGRLFSYSTVSSMLVNEQDLTFKVHLEESVSSAFIGQVKETLLAALEAFEGEEIKNLNVAEELTGTIVDDKNTQPVGSFFNIPIVINEKLAGLINIASTQQGLYKEDEMTILYKIVSQASTAVSKLRHVLETEKGKLSAMVESMSDGVIMVDNEIRLSVINPAARAFLSIQEPEPNIFAVMEAIGEKLELRKKVDEAREKDSLIVVDEAVIHDRALKAFFAPVKDRIGQKIGAVIVLHDISKAKELERLREDFTAMMVHELRSPLTAVRGASASLQSHTEEFSEEKKSEYLTMIEESAGSMLTIVNDLLDVAKIEAGKFSVNLGPVKLHQIITKKAEEYRSLASEKGLDLSTKLPSQEIEVSADSTRIGQVIANLLSNAIKFTEKGSIVIGLSADKEKATISVKDTGPGMEVKDQKRLFSKFGQLESNKPRTAEGTGLGLVIAKGIVEAHGGNIWVESKSKEGSTFSFTIPKAKS